MDYQMTLVFDAERYWHDLSQKILNALALAPHTYYAVRHYIY